MSAPAVVRVGPAVAPGAGSPAGSPAGRPARPPVVLHVIDTLRTGGAQWLLGALVAALAQDGLTRNVVVAGTADGADAALLGLLETHADRVEVLDARRLADPELLGGVLRGMRPLRPRLVHTHLVGANVNGRLAARWAGVPHLATVHTPPGGDEDTPGRRWADGVSARLSARIIVPSAAVGEAYAARWRVDPARVVVVPNPVPPRTPAVGARRAVRAGLGVRDDELLVLCLARLQPEKGVDVLLEAARGLAGVRVAVAGEGPERDRLAPAARAAGVLMLGHRDDVADLLQAADVVSLPSRHEALPLTLLEAMHAGRPVVASAVGGIPELLADGAGLLAPPGDAPALREALEHLREQPGLGAALAARAAARVAECHAPAAVARRHAELYAEVLEGARARGLARWGGSGRVGRAAGTRRG